MAYSPLTESNSVRISLGVTYPQVFQANIRHILKLSDKTLIAVPVGNNQLEIRKKNKFDALRIWNYYRVKDKIIQYLEDNKGWVSTIRDSRKPLLSLDMFKGDMISAFSIATLFDKDPFRSSSA